MGFVGLFDLQAVGPGRAVVAGSWRPNGATGIVSGSQKGRGFSVARTSAGLYTVTFDDKVYAMDAIAPFVRAADAVPTIVQAGDFNAANKTVQIRTFREAGSGLSTGIVQLPIAAARTLATSDTDVLLNHGGIMAKDSVPIFERANAGTDAALRLHWASSVSDEVHLASFVKPPDLDASSDVTLHLWAGMAGGTDTPTIGVDSWDDDGASMVSDTTAALSDTVGEVTATIAAADIGAAPGVFNIALTPGAHTTDALYIYGAWLEYTRSASAEFVLADLAADADNEVGFVSVHRNSGVPDA